MISIKLDFWFISFEKQGTHQSSDGWMNNRSELFDFGSNYAYFLFLSAPDKDVRAFIDTLQNVIEGQYCLTNIIVDKERSLSLGISINWLANQVGNPSDLKYILHKVLSGWNNQHSLFTWRHLAFYKEYQRVVNKELLTNSYFLQFLHLLVEEIQSEILSLNEGSFRQADLQKIREVERKILSDFHKPTPSVKEMAKIAGMSASKFKTLFSELYGAPPHHYVLDQKMIYAKALLLTGKYSITEVAYKVGYLYPSGFTRVYKQKFKHSPKTAYFKC